MSEGAADPVSKGNGRGWVRAAALLGVTLAISVFQPSVLVAVPLLALAAVFGIHGIGSVILVGLAMVVVATRGAGEAIWYVERGWALVVAGSFAAFTFRRPEMPFSTRALGSVGGALAVTAGFLGFQNGAWGSLDWMVRERMSNGVTTALEAIRMLRGGEAVPTSVVTAIQETVELQGDVFPATVALASMAALGVAWWVYRRVALGDDGALGPLRDFRFNDHLVWLLIGGLVLTVMQWGGVLARVGENALTFMGALYALRGAAVLLFLSGGLSLFGWIMLVLGLTLVPPLVLTGAMVIGIGDTWLDVRVRIEDRAT